MESRRSELVRCYGPSPTIFPRAEQGSDIVSKRDLRALVARRREESIQVRLLPGFGRLVAWKEPLASSKLRRMKACAFAPSFRRKHVVQHLVEDNGLDIKAGDPVVVQDGVHADELFRHRIGAESDRTLLRPGGTPPPRDTHSFEGSREVLLFQRREDKPQIVVRPLGANRYSTLATTDRAPLCVDEAIDLASGPTISMGKVAVERPHDVIRSIQEHSV